VGGTTITTVGSIGVGVDVDVGSIGVGVDVDVVSDAEAETTIVETTESQFSVLFTSHIL
jgi:hypothetical protein